MWFQKLSIPSHRRDFSLDPLPLLKFQSSFIHLLKLLSHWERPTPQEFPIPSEGNTNQEIPLAKSKEDKMADGTPRMLCMSHSPFNGADFCGEEMGHFRSSGEQTGNRFGTNTKLLCGGIGPIYTYTEWLSKYSIQWCSYTVQELQKQAALLWSWWEKLQLVAILSLYMKSLSLQERNILFVDQS